MAKLVLFKDRSVVLSEGRASHRLKQSIEANNLYFESPVISRRHAIIYMTVGKLYLKDEGSTHGTRFGTSSANSRILSPGVPQSLSDKMTISFGLDVIRDSDLFNAVSGSLRIQDAPLTPPKWTSKSLQMHRALTVAPGTSDAVQGISPECAELDSGHHLPSPATEAASVSDDMFEDAEKDMNCADHIKQHDGEFTAVVRGLHERVPRNVEDSQRAADVCVPSSIAEHETVLKADTSSIFSSVVPPAELDRHQGSRPERKELLVDLDDGTTSVRESRESSQWPNSISIHVADKSSESTPHWEESDSDSDEAPSEYETIKCEPKRALSHLIQHESQTEDWDDYCSGALACLNEAMKSSMESDLAFSSEDECQPVVNLYHNKTHDAHQSDRLASTVDVQSDIDSEEAYSERDSMDSIEVEDETDLAASISDVPKSILGSKRDSAATALDITTQTEGHIAISLLDEPGSSSTVQHDVSQSGFHKRTSLVFETDHFSPLTKRTKHEVGASHFTGMKHLTLGLILGIGLTFGGLAALGA